LENHYTASSPILKDIFIFRLAAAAAAAWLTGILRLAYIQPESRGEKISVLVLKEKQKWPDP